MILALHGLPTSPDLWARLPFPVVAPHLPGVDDDGPFSIDRVVTGLIPLVNRDTIVLGHDLGGVLAAELALRTQVRGVVLSGTALGPYWVAIRLTTNAPLDRPFYHRFGGRRFLAGSVAPERAAEALAAFPAVSPERMIRIARGMIPSPDLGRRLRRVKVGLVWGTRDRWYPPTVARAVARGTGGTLTWVEAGHLAPWEAPEAWGEAFRRVVQGW